jgi:hypothetical protein
MRSGSSSLFVPKPSVRIAASGSSSSSRSSSGGSAVTAKHSRHVHAHGHHAAEHLIDDDEQQVSVTTIHCYLYMCCSAQHETLLSASKHSRYRKL